MESKHPNSEVNILSGKDLNSLNLRVDLIKLLKSRKIDYTGALKLLEYENELVKLQIEMIQKKSLIIKELVQSGELNIIGAIYDVETGKVEFLDHVISINKKYEKLEVY